MKHLQFYFMFHIVV